MGSNPKNNLLGDTTLLGIKFRPFLSDVLLQKRSPYILVESSDFILTNLGLLSSYFKFNSK